jgi:hypothetical protein
MLRAINTFQKIEEKMTFFNKSSISFRIYKMLFKPLGSQCNVVQTLLKRFLRISSLKIGLKSISK